MRRRLFAILSAISLLLGVGTGVLWIRSYRTIDVLVFNTLDGNLNNGVESEYFVQSNRAVLRFNYNHFEYRNRNIRDEPLVFPTGLSWVAGPSQDPIPVPGPELWGFGLGHYVSGPGALQSGAYREHRALKLPHWFVSLLFFVLPAVWLRRAVRARRRRRLGLCLTCGYDLRASKDRCPECGMPIPAQPAA